MPRMGVNQYHQSSRPGESHPQALTDPDMVGIEPSKVTLVTPDVEPFATQEGFEVFGVVNVVRAIADEEV